MLLLISLICILNTLLFNYHLAFLFQLPNRSKCNYSSLLEPAAQDYRNSANYNYLKRKRKGWAGEHDNLL